MQYIKISLIIFLLLLSLTVGEWLIHKYVMHNKDGSFFRWLWGDAHNIHHRQVNDDMTLTNHNEENQELLEPGEEHPGLYFGVRETLLLAISILMVLKLIMYVVKFDCKVIYIAFISFSIAFFYKFMWDFLHYSFHDLRDDLEINKLNPYFYWWFRNHAYHHLVKGEAKGNYNIIVPGADFLFGTYRSCITNVKYCKENNDKICFMEINNKPLKHGFSFCENSNE